jgi:hypothetical protein
MEVRSRRDSGAIALIGGFFALMWFSSGGGEASSTLRAALALGSAGALVVAVLGAIRAIRGPRTQGAMGDPAARRRYGTVVGVEFALAAFGAGALGAAGVGPYIPVLICAVVGLHFFPLAPVFQDPALRWLGAAITAVAAAALLVGVFTGVPPSHVTGAGAGLALLAFSISALVGPRAAAPCRVDRP